MLIICKYLKFIELVTDATLLFVTDATLYGVHSLGIFQPYSIIKHVIDVINYQCVYSLDHMHQ
jgi:hypothetical protein